MKCGAVQLDKLPHEEDEAGPKEERRADPEGKGEGDRVVSTRFGGLRKLNAPPGWGEASSW